MAYEIAVNLTTMTGMFQYANRVTDNIFVIMLLLTIYIVPLIYLLYRHDWYSSFSFAGWIVTISAIILRAVEIITQDKYIFFCIVTIVIPIFIKLIEDTST